MINSTNLVLESYNMPSVAFGEIRFLIQLGMNAYASASSLFPLTLFIILGVREFYFQQEESVK